MVACTTNQVRSSGGAFAQRRLKLLHGILQQTSNNNLHSLSQGYWICESSIYTLLFCSPNLESFSADSGFNKPSLSLSDLWGPWRSNFRGGSKETWDTLARALIWNVLLERNRRIFDDFFGSSLSVINKISHMFMLWVSTILNQKRKS